MKSLAGTITKCSVPQLAILLLIFSNAQCESLQYEIIKANKNIGQINIEQKKHNDTTEYIFESAVKLRIIFEIEVFDRMRAVFKGNQLVFATLYRTVNGRLKIDNMIKWERQFYEMTNKEHQHKHFDEPIGFTTAYMYYNEPLRTTKIFSENFQQLMPIRNVGGTRYRMDLPNGHKNFYTYKKGVCHLVEAETDWADLKFVLKKRS